MVSLSELKNNKILGKIGGGFLIPLLCVLCFLLGAFLIAAEKGYSFSASTFFGSVNFEPPKQE